MYGVSDIEGGIFFSLVVKSDGTVWAWGWNSQGLLGIGIPGDGNSFQAIPTQCVKDSSGTPLIL